MSPPSSPSVFLTGGTGYVGGCFLNRLLATKPRQITVLTRSEQKVDLIESLSNNDTTVKALQGSFSDTKLLTDAAYEHDIVVEAGDSDNPELVDALLQGMKKRQEEGKGITTFLHVSGTGTLVDDARGEFKGEVVSTTSLYLLHPLTVRPTPMESPSHHICSA